MSISKLRILMVFLVTLVAALVASQLSGVSGVASAASDLGGPITRSEVLERAGYWITNPPPNGYSMNGTHTDSSGTRYRTDCSGFASMALHINKYPSPSTVDLGSSAYTVPISRDDLKPGDLMNIANAGAAGHVRIFVSWVDASRSSYNYIDFGGGRAPKKDVSSYPGVKKYDGKTYQYVPRRYNKIVDDPTPATNSSNVRVDFNGDGKTDLLGRRGTDVQVSLSNGGSFNWSTQWTTWSTAYTMSTGDFNGDGKTDLFGYNASTGDIQVALSNGGSFNPSTRWGSWSSAYTIEL